ncbi:Clp protease N-terminal domain-containing protein [Jiangella alba]|uniref:Clp amino terminal domain-containing protein, pathogenicity island component n=1 Tax=Jiangella alba TaxID=561176 RepID=A0A1H5J0K7_9ACTN|nr:Clp protease N-terminal domain-containing protein [Jiangella alba]SEE45817.1 Clp amino terminal domain-containing protein, pathogenicity island component [Jiangella alba]
MFERFTLEARHAVIGAQEEARDLRHGWIGTEHVLLALLATPDAPGVATLTRLGVTAERGRDAVVAVDGGGAPLGDEDTEALKTFGIDLDEVRRRAEEAFGEGALDAPLESGRGKRFGVFRRGKQPDGRLGHIPFAPRAKKALELSLREAIARKDGSIGTQHILLGLLRSDDQQTLAVFERLGIQPRVVREQVLADLSEAA